MPNNVTVDSICNGNFEIVLLRYHNHNIGKVFISSVAEQHNIGKVTLEIKTLPIL